MTFKSAMPPRCRYCGGKIRKRTHTILFGQSKPSIAGFVTNHSAFPRSKEEAQRLFNEEIVSVRWMRGDHHRVKESGGDYICQATSWDRESYEDEFFCIGEHAKSFAYAAARRGYVMPAYLESKQGSDA